MSEPRTVYNQPRSNLIKWLWFMFAFILIAIFGSYTLQKLVIFPSFITLEHDEAEKNQIRCLEAITNEIAHLDRICADWSVWDDTYQFVQDKNQAYIKANLDWESLAESTKINLLVFCKADGGVIWGEAYDSNLGGNIEIAEFQPDILVKGHYLLACNSIDRKITGIITTGHGPMIISARPILTTKGQGPINAVMIMGRFLNADELNTIANQTRVPFTTTDLCRVSPTPHEELILAELAHKPFVSEEISKDELHGYGKVTDLNGKPALLVKTVYSRDIMKRGQATAHLASWFFVGMLFIVLIAVWIAMRLVAMRHSAEHAEMLVEERTVELKESEKRMELALQGADLGTWDWNLETGRFIVNERWASMLGYTPNEIAPLSDTWKNMIHPDDIQDVDAALNAHLQGKTEFYETEHRIHHKSGNWVWVLDKGKVITRDAQNKPLRICGTHLDITERKRVEGEQLTLERQMLHAQKLESLGVLAGGIAHDFNNILTGVLGYASLAKQDLPETQPAYASVQAIERAAKRAAELAQQMLSYSGRGSFVIKEIDVSALMDDMVSLLRTTIARTTTLELNFARSLPLIEADAAQMQQVVMNLITNAAEAIDKQPGTIVFSTGQMECTETYLAKSLSVSSSLYEAPPPGLYVYFEVTDTGCGMDDKTKSRIFDPFFTTKFTGRGLGMAAVLGIVRGHKGTIMLDTELGQGTTFRVLFPAITKKCNESPKLNAQEPVWEKSTVQNQWAHGTILVMDDEPVVRDLVKELLERQGFSVVSAKDGHEGLQIFRERANEFACVLLDLTMPHMDGEACLDELRRIKSDVRVILSSGYSEQEVAQRFINKGLMGFIQKPYQSAALEEILLEALR